MSKQIHLGGLSIEPRKYASEGSAILGIRGSGKSYTATFLAEQLIDNGVPFTAFDPIGIWRNLKVPGKGPGYKVVVAGEDADLPLTPESAPEIVRAAMHNGVSLVIDLYSMALSKSDWKKIVETCVRLMLYENKNHGLRHIFIEEAAEFCPQRVGPDQGRVYAEIEKLARMGGNAMLGYTMINQRAEEVNKAVLELCDCLFLHRQKGRNSLTALGKWLDFADAGASKEIVKSLPMLNQGQLWVWMPGTDKPVLVKVPEKQSHHPDRQQAFTGKTSSKAVDVSEFVEEMSLSLEQYIESAKENDPEQLKKKVKELEKQLANQKPTVETKEVPVLTLKQQKHFEELQRDIRIAISQTESLVDTFSELSKHIQLANSDALELIHKMSPSQAANRPAQVIRKAFEKTPARDHHSNGALGRCEQAVLNVIATYGHRTKAQTAILSGYSLKSSGFKNALSTLRVGGYIEGSDPLSITANGEKIATQDEIPTGMKLVPYWQAKLDRCEGAILGIVVGRKDGYDKSQLANASGYSPDSSGFKNALSKLRVLELIQRGDPIKPATIFFE